MNIVNLPRTKEWRSVSAPLMTESVPLVTLEFLIRKQWNNNRSTLSTALCSSSYGNDSGDVGLGLHMDLQWDSKGDYDETLCD